MEPPYSLPRKKPYTKEQVKSLFRKAGIPVSLWAKANNFPVNRVYLVLSGSVKGNYGMAHEIAVSLGLKLKEVA